MVPTSESLFRILRRTSSHPDKQAAEVAAVVAQRHTRRALVTFVAALVVIIACVLIVALTLW